MNPTDNERLYTELFSQLLGNALQGLLASGHLPPNIDAEDREEVVFQAASLAYLALDEVASCLKKREGISVPKSEAS
jgi:hypothetical protein